MSIATTLLAEFEHEAATTRRFLERIPADKLHWKPHDKSHTAGELGLHIASLPGNIARFALADQSEIPGPDVLFKPPATVQEILDAHAKSVETVRQILPTLDDARLTTTTWTGTVGGKPVATLPKTLLLRLIMMNHWIQHRGQLGVYLRLLGAKVPASYGPSGDEA
jgi:uncharacterized damage-inducible protein DinB